ncbi:acetyl-CoA hydrolase/transferase family protein [Parahaliea mediterranea]|uniref:acetyl-CoA hydrolase/transferase family protein n=1 Tax=Parahaliea mediterranea TaxID=651086 RepID=UPI000E2FA7AF|nr:acetyl-CoA hydrolase/transferase C-terminal domain-containing protein [Parahaliea mediterranea]
MTRWVESAAEAVSGIRSGDVIWSHSMAATPLVLLDALAQHARQCDNLTLLQLHLEHATALADPALDGHLRCRCFFAGRETRDLINQGLADYVPIFLSEIPRLMRRGEQPVNVALIQVSEPDRHGNCSLGVSVEVTAAACEVADRIIAHVNPNVPRTLGDSFVHIDAIDVAYREASPLIYHEVHEPGEIDREIGARVATLVEDGACLQMGIGSIPDAALACLGSHRDLGVHTEMFSDGVLGLLQRGVITNSRKKIGRGRVVTTFAMGSPALYDFVDDNPEVAFLDVEFVNSPVTIARNKRVTSINSAIQIDLTGQVCADSIGHRIYSGVGGQVDFVLGAAHSEGGKSIIALPSTARGGSISRLVPSLATGAGVVTTRAQVDYVVTEYGMAQMRGRSLQERASALLAIAHPDFREDLARQAREALALRI